MCCQVDAVAVLEAVVANDIPAQSIENEKLVVAYFKSITVVESEFSLYIIGRLAPVTF